MRAERKEPLGTALIVMGLVLASLGCRARDRHGERRRASAQTPPPARTADPKALAAVVPDDSGPFYPSLARTVGGDGSPKTMAMLSNTDGCGGCHLDETRQWRSSAHGHASFDNPWYRAVVDQVRSSAGNTASRHCGGCHDPLLLVTGQMDGPIDANSAYATKGVTCMICHGVVETRPDGNASYTLNLAPVPIPREGDPESLRKHRERVAAAPLKTAALCNTCHRGFLGTQTGNGHHLTGIEEPGPWRASPWAGSHGNYLEHAASRSCPDCHMPDDPSASSYGVPERSHRFAGAHTALAALSGDRRQRSALEANLSRAVELDVPVVRRNGHAYLTSDPIDVKPADHLEIDVVARNTGVGHNFPGGVKDMQDSWIELTLTDARGQTIGAAGGDQENEEDPSAYVLRAVVLDASGKPETKHLVNRFDTLAFDHTIGPFAARVVRYAVTLPEDAQAPFVVQARLRHRRHRLEARALACEATRSARGQAFAAAARAEGSFPLDGCAAEPVFDMATATVRIGAGTDAPLAESSDAPAARPAWSRLYVHALGLSNGLGERLTEARASVDRALSLADDAATPPEAKAQLLVLRGRIAARQARLDDALGYAAAAQALVGDQPAVDRVRAEAYMQGWRWADAAAALTRVTAGAPGDTAAWRDLARARMSVGDAPGAYDAAVSGLRLQPRDEGLLRCETLALEALRSPEAPRARAAFLRYREADATTDLRFACGLGVKNCERDRQPIVTIDLDLPLRTTAERAP